MSSGTTGLAVAAPIQSALIPAEKLQKVHQMDLTLRQAQHELTQAQAGGMVIFQGVVVARAMQALRTLMTKEIMEDFMALMNNPLGFATDRDPTKTKKDVRPYDVDTVRDCMIEGLILGARPVNGEITIISARAYLSKPFYERRCLEVPGVSALQFEVGVPGAVPGAKGALVEARASWIQGGQPCRVECARTTAGDFRIPVKMDEYSSADQIRGKATRKLLKMVYQRMTGHLVQTEAMAEEDVIDAQYSPAAPEATATNGSGNGGRKGKQAAAAAEEPVADHTQLEQAVRQAEAKMRNAKDPQHVEDIHTRFRQDAAKLAEDPEDWFSAEDRIEKCKSQVLARLAS